MSEVHTMGGWVLVQCDGRTLLGKRDLHFTPGHAESDIIRLSPVYIYHVQIAQDRNGALNVTRNALPFDVIPSVSFAFVRPSVVVPLDQLDAADAHAFQKMIDQANAVAKAAVAARSGITLSSVLPLNGRGVGGR